MEQKFMWINIIDPTSTEFNRGSFCYAPYLCYNGFSNSLCRTDKVTLMESFQAEDLDDIPNADIHIVTLWSYPQIEASVLLAQMIPFMHGRGNVYFVGYWPLIEHLGLRHISEFYGKDPLSDPAFLKIAMKSYPDNYANFKRLLLSDCDMHLKQLEIGEVVHPLFTTYGCPNGCSFCPSTVNCGKSRIVLSKPVVKEMLEKCHRKDIKNIHFTDEDFFFDIDRAYTILTDLVGMDMHLIALGSAKAVLDFITKYGTEIIAASGLEVIEIGFESASPVLSKKMGMGKSLDDCTQLAINSATYPFQIFWLVQTFYMGETIQTLNETGRFMQKYGFQMEEVVGRLRTNGTTGGLGQFFQPYHGTPVWNYANKNGLFITSRAVRLLPSYIPNSFLDSIITDVHTDKFDSAMPWLALYNIQFNDDRIEKGMKLRDSIEHLPMYQRIQKSIELAILARMEVIT